MIKNPSSKPGEPLQLLAAYQRAVDTSSIVSITDLTGVILYANRRFCEISGYDEAELVGKTHRVINSGFHSKEFFQGLWKHISQGQNWRGEIRNRAKDGNYYWVDTVIAPMRDDEGRIFRYLSIRNIITDKKD